MIKVFIPFFKIHIVEVIVDLGSWEALLSFIWLFSLELFDRSSLWIKMTSIPGWGMHLFHLSMSRSSEALKCYITDGYSLTHASLSAHESVLLMAVIVAPLWSGSGQQRDITCCPDEQWQRRFGRFLLTCFFTHKMHFCSTDGKRRKKGSVFLLKRDLRGPAVLISQYFQRRHIAGIIPV